jgi:nucleoside-triphosphatase
VASRLARLLGEAHVPVRGFVTKEIRAGRRRVGFAIEVLGGGKGILAHVEIPGPPRVGRYGVDLEAFERLVIPALSSGPGVTIVDELGKMELASARFREAALELFRASIPVVATPHAHPHPFTDSLKRTPGVETMRVTNQSRDRIPRELAKRLAGG